MTQAGSQLVTRGEIEMTADPSRVLARLFVPGHELLADRESRASGVVARILALSEEDVEQTVEHIQDSYAGRHRDFAGVIEAHYEQMAHRVPAGTSLSPARRTLIGAAFTNEFSIEGAALFNPSAVEHPDQSGLQPGQVRFLLSLRAVGEGHVSCVEFRTGVAGPGHEVRLDDPGPHVEAGRIEDTWYDRELFASALADASAESASYFIDSLPARFSEDDLEKALTVMNRRRVTRVGGARTDELARRIARCNYEVVYPAASTIPERVIWPHAPSESNGIEDARFVRMDTDDGPVYRATYTAFDGAQIAPQLIETVDFRRFRLSQLAGPAAKDKGMALFPRKVNGRYAALSRSDRETSGITTSVDGGWWDEPTPLYGPSQAWELIQTGNCGSPIETAAGWIVLTHGVGPMREYAIGALLLDLDEPAKVIGALRQPLLSPQRDERNGYVPNVLYSCGALLHGDQLLLPYGASDARVRFAFVDVPLLLERLTADGPPAAILPNSSA